MLLHAIGSLMVLCGRIDYVVAVYDFGPSPPEIHIPMLTEI